MPSTVPVDVKYQRGNLLHIGSTAIRKIVDYALLLELLPRDEELRSLQPHGEALTACSIVRDTSPNHDDILRTLEQKGERRTACICLSLIHKEENALAKLLVMVPNCGKDPIEIPRVLEVVHSLPGLQQILANQAKECRLARSLRTTDVHCSLPPETCTLRHCDDLTTKLLPLDCERPETIEHELRSRIPLEDKFVRLQLPLGTLLHGTSEKVPCLPCYLDIFKELVLLPLGSSLPLGLRHTHLSLRNRHL
mmetsp:Transcript_29675/g.71525  ORF Transcript_29675/g.71525 Transcript_29675/m.71525 type:complete len:251 (-) Transcript_29675:55-807(-)